MAITTSYLVVLGTADSFDDEVSTLNELMDILFGSFDDEISTLNEVMDGPFGFFDDSTVSLGGMSEREISRLRTEEFTGDEEEGECCICLEGFLEGAVITPLAPCSHRFHHLCIVPWLRNNPTCPLCRTRSTVPAV
ncbi:PREDICTED: E3 ubiquitin-protein ligase At4g11680-like [Ipomoea nil]|uniref:E3 ubiquitin-protein ligase At4g11680-like n=1 Tax=Ipomoea nil TaxID=35883 RepID=UPI000901DB53|nr:PREDICTED: E3 ubiquitin-protein ligase At4g11680-like [Ipomoea nil]